MRQPKKRVRSQSDQTRIPRQVAIVAYDGTILLDLTGPLQAFSDARFEDGRPAYEVILASEKGGLVRTDTGITLDTVKLTGSLVAPLDTLLVSGGNFITPPVGTESLERALAKHIDRPRRFGSICTGAFILARLGVLDGREATTHWAACNTLSREYPKVKVRPDSIYISSGRIWTSAGVSAGIDMALAMIEEDLGRLAALQVARRMVLFLKRPGGQSQFSVELERQMSDARGKFDGLHQWITGHLRADLSVPALAEAARMSPRNFTRVYSQETGDSPARAVERIRVEAARRLLEASPISIKEIATQTGFGDDERLRRSFLKIHGVSPQDYRGRFGPN